jgi:HEPN domain-containing protein
MSENNPWIKYVEDDFGVLLELEDSEFHRSICFHAQQLAEKILKAVLHEQKKKIPKTHDILLLKKLTGFIFPVSDKELEFLSSVYSEARYPPDVGLLPHGEPNKEDAMRATRIARAVYEFVKTRI